MRLKRKNYEEMTQKYSTFGEKLLQHCDRLNEIQTKGKWRPINVQMSLTSACQLDCVFCSVKNRPKGVNLNFELAKKGLEDFRKLGAKALEISGGGDPLLYPYLNSLIYYAYGLGYEIGIIANDWHVGRFLDKDSAEKLAWYRASLHGLDYGVKVEDYDFSIIPNGKLGFSYIINKKTTKKTLKDIARLVELRPDVKFVRLAGDCLDGKNLLKIKKKWGRYVDKLNKSKKFFIKEINENYKPYPHFCGVGAIRPYCVENGKIYACTSHVLEKRDYDDRFAIGELKDVRGMYKRMNATYKRFGRLYSIDPKKCWHCFYYNNNALLHNVIKKIPDANFA